MFSGILEVQVDEKNPIKSIKSVFSGGRIPCLFLRHKPEESDYDTITVYPGMLKYVLVHIKKFSLINTISLIFRVANCNYQRINVNIKTTVSETIKIALEKFDIPVGHYEK